jgi:hypothetical protein
MTEKNIKEISRELEFVPFGPESVGSKLAVQLQTPTPVDEVADPSTLWVSKSPKTPKTLLEAGPQSEYLKKTNKKTS